MIPMMREFDSNERVAPVNGEALALRQAKGALHGQRLFARKAIRATIRKRRWRRLPRSRRRVKRAPGERIAHALNLRIRSIQLRQPLIDGIAGRRAAQGPARPALASRSIDRGCDWS